MHKRPCSIIHYSVSDHLLYKLTRRYLSTTESKPAQLSLLNATQYCQDRVKVSDYDQYLTSLAIPTSLTIERRISYALKALNLELASIRDSSRKPVDEQNHLLIGRMKIQFWRDLIDQSFKPTSTHNQHPVSVVLAHGLQSQTLSKTYIHHIIDARESNLSVRQYPTLNILEEYGEWTCASMIYLHLQLFRVKSESSLYQVASHLGKAQSLVNILKGVPYLLDRRIFYLPADICAKHDVSVEQVFRTPQHSEGLGRVVYDIATRAHDHIITARTMLAKHKDSDPGLNGQLNHRFYALLPAVPTLRWLNRLQKSDFNLFDRQLYQRDPWLPAYIWWANYRKQF